MAVETMNTAPDIANTPVGGRKTPSRQSTRRKRSPPISPYCPCRSSPGQTADALLH
ncbi:hypothetical protein J4732_10615 [Serratia marcescens]|uniref:Uncharacterized protein n=1 Tax=Serratia marcescens TaxID=615 RepID=A0A939NJX2_SERMA|nr:hypothetical protein [Serratia marcescens]